MAQRKLEDFFRGKRKSREEHGEEERDDGAKPSDISTAAEPNASVESTSRANVSDSGLSGDVQPSSSAPSSAHSRTNNAAAENMVKPKKQKHALDCLLRLNINGPPPEKFPYAEAVKLWAQKKERRYRVTLV